MSERSPNTLLELLDVGASGRIAIQVPDGPSLTYDSLRRQVHNLASQLRSVGLGKGDRIIIVLPSGIEAVVGFLAAAAVGTAAPLNPDYKADEFRFFMEDTEHKALITVAGGGEVARSVAPASTLQINAELDSDGVMTFTNLPKGGGLLVVPPDPDDTALVLHTSGTTSRPKRVPLKHRNIAASTVNIRDCYGLTPEDVSLCIMPLFHVHGLVASVITTFLAGGTVIVPSRFNPMRFWPVVEEYNVSWFSAVPTLYRALLSRSHGESNHGARRAPSMRFIRSCSAPLAAEMMRNIEDSFGLPVLEAYGMTEAAHQMASNPLPPDPRKPGSVGRGTGVEIAIMDEMGELLPVGHRGEVVIQGPNVTKGYEDNPEANANSFTHGWFRTGDEGSLGDDGYLVLTGRIKEQINRSGEKISPQEIDELLLAHPAVGEAVCFAAPHPTHGEEPEAAVVLTGDVTERDLVRYCRKHVADYKVPRLIHIVPEIPKTATGKVQRRLVAEKILGGAS